MFYFHNIICLTSLSVLMTQFHLSYVVYVLMSQYPLSKVVMSHYVINDTISLAQRRYMYILQYPTHVVIRINVIVSLVYRCYMYRHNILCLTLLHGLITHYTLPNDIICINDTISLV